MARFDHAPFEDGLATERATADEVLRLSDYPAYFDLLERPLPANRDAILAALADDRLIRPCDAGSWNITNLGAILFANAWTPSTRFAARRCGSFNTAEWVAPRR